MSSGDQDLAYWCEAAEQLDFTTFYLWQNIAKAVLNSLSMVLIVFMFAKRLVWIHNQFHGLIGFKLCVVWIYALNNSITHWLPVIRRLMSADPCDYVFVSKDCLVFKIVQNCCVLSMSTTIFLLLLERTLSLHPQITDRCCRFVTRAFILFEIMVFLYITFKSIEIEGDQVWPILHCLEETRTLRPLSHTISIAVPCIDGPTMVYCLLLRFYTLRLLKRDHHSLSSTYRVRYALTIIDAFIPVIFFHGAVLLLNNSLMLLSPILVPRPDLVTKKNWGGLANIMPYYTVIMPVLYLLALKKIRARRDREFLDTKEPRIDGKVVPEGDFYHMSMQSAWETRQILKENRKWLRLGCKTRGEIFTQ